ncbi:conserved hypothetical protein [Roseibium sp. TrichSKD4]|uniref:hypothetical protein n=1 Tax=Roseibium sp. TrichSKD4 TaxID=744980 RepID=UPI0001E569C2|nr:hypothetical protein [Roseibium sp. TrichSKD4]EFO32501.1 conserved hypothetical protein [Roseibium sp. TrichSKD4]
MPNEFPTSAPVQPANPVPADPGSAPQPAIGHSADISQPARSVPSVAAAQEPSEPPAQAGVVNRLKAYRDQHSGSDTFPLPETGVVVSLPKFRSHGAWSSCLRMAKNNIQKAQVLYICKVVTFDGEKLTAADYDKYIPLEDSMELLSRMFGGTGDEEDHIEGDQLEGELQETA